jgi:hypothetical protein
MCTCIRSGECVCMSAFVYTCIVYVVSTKRGRQSTKGYAQGSDLSVDTCASYELDGDARHETRFYLGSAVVRA